MFGKNPIEPTIHGDGKTLRVVKGSPFLTIQGEGPFTGRAAVFVRLHGCNLRCTFCDTNFSDPDDPFVDVEKLIDDILSFHIELAVITGGEPLRQPIVPLCRALAKMGMTAQIETAGTLWQEDIEKYSLLIVSPKTAIIHPLAFKHAYAFKYIIDVDQQFDDGYIPTTATQPHARPRPLARPRSNAPIYLSPCDTQDAEHNAANKALVARLAMIHPEVIAGCQLHKVLGIKEPA